MSRWTPGRRRTASATPVARVVLVGTLLGVMAGSMGGCQRSLFKVNAPRTQFDAYDAMRDQYVPMKEPDVFGNPQPALRPRLER